MEVTEAVTSAEKVAQLFHETYERLSPSLGYETRKASAVPWEQVPENNRKLMIATVESILPAIQATDGECQKLRSALERIERKLSNGLSDDALDIARAALKEQSAVKAIVAKAPDAGLVEIIRRMDKAVAGCCGCLDRPVEDATLRGDIDAALSNEENEPSLDSTPEWANGHPRPR